MLRLHAASQSLRVLRWFLIRLSVAMWGSVRHPILMERGQSLMLLKAWPDMAMATLGMPAGRVAIRAHGEVWIARYDGEEKSLLVDIINKMSSNS